MITRFASLLALIALSAAALAAPAEACARIMTQAEAAAAHGPHMHGVQAAHHGHAVASPAPAAQDEGAPCPHGDCSPVADVCDEAPAVIAPAPAPLAAVPPARSAPPHPALKPAPQAPRAPPEAPRPAPSPVDLFIKQLN